MIELFKHLKTAARLRENYERTSRVARLQAAARAASDHFVGLAGDAIEKARVFAATGCTDDNHRRDAVSAWSAAKDAQRELLNFNDEAPPVSIN